MSSKQPIRLQNLPRFKVRNPVSKNSQSANSCLVVMSSLLNCWASNGEGNATCMGFQNELKTCMETRKPTVVTKSSINYHAGRLYPRVSGTKK